MYQFTRLGLGVVFACVAIVAGCASILKGSNCDASTPRPILDQTINVTHLWTTCTGLSASTRGMFLYENSLILGDYTRDAMVSFDTQSGSMQWSTPMQGNGSLTFDPSRERIYTYTIFGSLREVYAIDPNTGDIMWYNGVQNGTRDGYSPILLADGQLLARAILSGTVRRLDTTTGEFGDTIPFKSLAVYPDGYAWHISDRYLVGTDAITGDVFWRASDPIPGSCCLWDVQTNDEAVLAELGADIVVYDFDTGQLRWNTIDLNIVGDASLTTDTVYALDLGARFHVLDTLNGIEQGYVQFQPADPGHDTDLLASDSISSSQHVADGEIIAIYFGDTDMLSVYRVS